MTRQDHDTDELITTLRSPARSSEQAGEAAAVAAMLEVLPTGVSARPVGLRSRRGAVIAAVTVASLGVGGLAAAGPGFFQAAADRSTVAPDTSSPPITDADHNADHDDDRDGSGDGSGDGGEDAAEVAVEDAVIATDDTVECVGETHGDTVSSIARATEPGPDHGETVSNAAKSDCGKIDDDDSTEPAVATDDTVECVGETHGDTVSSIARATEPGPGHGEAVSNAAKSDCGKTGDGKTGNLAPGKPDDEVDNRPGKPEDTPGKPDDTPGKPDDTPGKPDDTPGKPDDTPGRPDDTPGRPDDTPSEDNSRRPPVATP